MYVTCEELGKTLEISVRFFKEGNWSVLFSAAGCFT